MGSLFGDTPPDTGPAPRQEHTGALLAVDVGSVHTRAVLIDMAEGVYRLFATAQAPSTGGPPWENIQMGVIHTLEQISAATGRTVLDQSLNLIVPERDDFFGVEHFAATASAGKPIRAVLVGLVPGISLDSARRAAESVYLEVIDTISLADTRSQERQIEAIVQAAPDVIIISGGTDDGAVATVRRMIETVALTCLLLRRSTRVTVIYAGNPALHQEVHATLMEGLGIHTVVTGNVRPGLFSESLEGVQTELAAFYNTQKARSTSGFEEITEWADEAIHPTSHAFGQMITIMGTLERRNVLGIDLGSSATTIAAFRDSRPTLSVFSRLGIGHSLRDALRDIRPEALLRWMAVEADGADQVMDAAMNRWLYPHTIPVTAFDRELTYALAREITRHALHAARQRWKGVPEQGVLSGFDTILLSGATLAQGPHHGWGLLAALDALLPVGVARVLIDPYGLTPAFGALSSISARAVVQAMETAFLDIGTVIAVSGKMRRGDVALRGQVTVSGLTGFRTDFEVPFGSLMVVPLEPGLEAELVLQPRGVTISGLPGGTSRLKIRGGEMGIIIDARGRPWRFPPDGAERREMITGWEQALTRQAGPEPVLRADGSV
ncbi:MAG: glutamate mutase L [Anaerolineae bacterium]|nr:glutamate mutase L [Anaerolineae bacterium]